MGLVVGIDDDGNTKIFNKALTPYLINKILEGKEEQGTVRVSFDIFPMQKNEICNVVMDFIRDAKKQELFTCVKIPALEEFLNAAGKDISFVFQCSGIGYDINEPYKYLFNHETLEQSADDEQMKAGIHILLGNYKIANRCLDKLDMGKRIEFCEFPIYRLME